MVQLCLVESIIQDNFVWLRRCFSKSGLRFFCVLLQFENRFCFDTLGVHVYMAPSKPNSKILKF